MLEYIAHLHFLVFIFRWFMNLGRIRSSREDIGTQTIVTDEESSVDDIGGVIWRREYAPSRMNIGTWRYRTDDSPTFEQYSRSILESMHTALNSNYRVINITIPYIDVNDVVSWLSFPRSDIDELGIENIVHRFIEGSNILTDKDYIKDFLMNATVLTSRYNIITERVLGGYRRSSSLYYECVDIYSEHNNCLIDCFNHICSKSFDANDVRKKLHIPLYYKMGISDIRSLESYYKVKICVLEDSRDVEYAMVNKRHKLVKNEPVVLYGDIQNKPWILNHDEHFSVIKKEKKFIRRDHIRASNKEEREVYYFFDYETTYDPITLDVEPYAWSLVRCDKDGNILWKKFSLATESILDSLDLTKKSYLIGFNNSRFDNFILLRQCMMEDVRTSNVFFADNTILGMSIMGSNVKDLCRFLNTSLNKACKDFKCENKKIEGFPHQEFQSMRNKGMLDSFIQDNMEFIKKYVTMDCICLAELYFKVRREFYNLLDVDMLRYNTLAGMSYDRFINNNPLQSLPVAEDMEDDTAMRSTIYGGRCQIFNRCEVADNSITIIDCNSLYPHVMMSNVFPEGPYDVTHTYQHGFIGIYSCDIISQSPIKIIPKRFNTLDWTYEDIITGDNIILNSIDIDCITRYGGKVKVHYGIYWEKSRRDVFRRYFSRIKNEKIRQDSLKDTTEYNGVLRECCKLLLNSLSGKLAQRNYDTVTSLIRNHSEKGKFLSKIISGTETFSPIYNCFVGSGKKNDLSTEVPIIYGSLIYSYARTYMYDMVLSKVDRDDLYGMDTDSAFLTNFDLHDIIGDDFGQFKIEHIGMNGIFVAPKCYCIYNNEYTKMVFKGIRVDRDKVLEEDISHWSIDEIHGYYFSDDHNITIDTYRNMLTTRVKILCSNLEKRVSGGDNVLSLRNRFIVKYIDSFKDETIVEYI